MSRSAAQLVWAASQLASVITVLLKLPSVNCASACHLCVVWRLLIKIKLMQALSARATPITLSGYSSVCSFSQSLSKSCGLNSIKWLLLMPVSGMLKSKSVAVCSWTFTCNWLNHFENATNGFILLKTVLKKPHKKTALKNLGAHFHIIPIGTAATSPF